MADSATWPTTSPCISGPRFPSTGNGTPRARLRARLLVYRGDHAGERGGHSGLHAHPACLSDGQACRPHGRVGARGAVRCLAGTQGRIATPLRTGATGASPAVLWRGVASSDGCAGVPLPRPPAGCEPWALSLARVAWPGQCRSTADTWSLRWTRKGSGQPGKQRARVA